MINEQKRKLFEAHLQQQNRKREQLIENKKVTQSTKNNPQQNMLFIQKSFKDMQKQFEYLLTEYKSQTINFQQLQKSYSKLKQYYVQVNYVLTTYDRQFYKEILQKIFNSMIDLKKKFQPRKNFKFSRRDEDFGVKTGEIKAQRLQKKHQAQLLSIPGVTDKTGETILINDKQNAINSFKMVSCVDCSITLETRSQTIYLKQLKNCVISCALTKSTVFVDNCSNCTFQLNCHQLRIHNTYDTTFFIFVTSKAIIQDCNRVVFTPYTFDYQNKSKDQVDYQRKGEPNLWKDIQDFNWLKENQKSPHYQLKDSL